MGDWNSFLTENLVFGAVKGGGLFGKDKSTWAASSNFCLTPENIAFFCQCLDDTKCHTAPQSVVINDDKYMNTTSPNDKGALVRLTGPINRDVPKSLIFGMSTDTGIIVAFTDTNNENRKSLVDNVTKVAKHLSDCKY